MRQMAGGPRPRSVRLFAPWDRPVFGESLGHGRIVSGMRSALPDPLHRMPRVRSLRARLPGSHASTPFRPILAARAILFFAAGARPPLAPVLTPDLTPDLTPAWDGL